MNQRLAVVGLVCTIYLDSCIHGRLLTVFLGSMTLLQVIRSRLMSLGHWIRAISLLKGLKTKEFSCASTAARRRTRKRVYAFYNPPADTPSCARHIIRIFGALLWFMSCSTMSNWQCMSVTFRVTLTNAKRRLLMQSKTQITTF